MLFRKKITKSCMYCTHGTKIDEETVLCIKKGLVLNAPTKKCRRFLYDPCKRIPARQKAIDFIQYDNQDFSL